MNHHTPSPISNAWPSVTQTNATRNGRVSRRPLAPPCRNSAALNPVLRRSRPANHSRPTTIPNWKAVDKPKTNHPACLAEALKPTPNQKNPPRANALAPPDNPQRGCLSVMVQPFRGPSSARTKYYAQRLRIRLNMIALTLGRLPRLSIRQIDQA